LNIALRPNGLQTMEALRASSIKSATGRMCSCEARAIKCLFGTLRRYVRLSALRKTCLMMRQTMTGLCSSSRVHPWLEQDWALHPRWTDDNGSGAHGHTRGSGQRPAPRWRCHFHRLVHYTGLGDRTFSDDRGMEQFHRHSLEFCVRPKRDVNLMLSADRIRQSLSSDDNNRHFLLLNLSSFMPVLRQ
jgi:hypothetical protein